VSTGGAGPGPAPGTAPVRRDVDQAAVLGTALAAVVALGFGGAGEWDWLATVTGLALLAVLSAFVHLPAPTAPAVRAHLQLAALSAVTALAATLVVAAPVQAVLAAASDGGRTCRVSAAVAAGTVRADAAQRRGAQVAVGAPADGPAADGAAVEDALARAAAEERRTVLGECLGALTSRWLWVPATVLAVAVFTATGLRRRAARVAPG
jgi:hypothetical protein